MTNDANMSTPVTRDELRDELTQLEQRVDRRFEQVDRRFEQVDRRFEQLDRRFEQISVELTNMATKVELTQLEQRVDLWGGALMDRIEQSEKRLMMEMARHTQANHEASMRFLAAIDDKYTDLPGRVSRLEGAVFPDEGR